MKNFKNDKAEAGGLLWRWGQPGLQSENPGGKATASKQKAVLKMCQGSMVSFPLLCVNCMTNRKEGSGILESYHHDISVELKINWKHSFDVLV